MVDSGIKPSVACEELISEMGKRQQKSTKKFDYLIMRIVEKGGEIRKEGDEVLINNGKKAAVEVVEVKEMGTCAEENPDHNEEKKGPVDWYCFGEALQRHQLAFGMAYFGDALLCVYYTDEGYDGPRVGTQTKMTYTSTVRNVTNKTNHKKYIEAQDQSDLTPAEIKKRLLEKK